MRRVNSYRPMLYQLFLEWEPGKEIERPSVRWDWAMQEIEDYFPRFEIEGSDAAGLWIIKDDGKPVGEMIPHNKAGKALHKQRLWG